MTFADQYVTERTEKNAFLSQINRLVRWDDLRSVLSEHKGQIRAPRGRKAYDSIVLFKMCLLLGIISVIGKWKNRYMILFLSCVSVA